MKLIIAGTRDYSPDTMTIAKIVHIAKFDVTEVVSGCARGVDQCGERYAIEYGINIKRFPVTREEWTRIGPSAGIKRNLRMAEYADGLLAFWDGQSPGTRHMISEAVRRRMPTVVYFYKTGAIETWNLK